MRIAQYCFIGIALLLTSCGTNTTVSTGPFADLGPVNVSATVDNNGVVTLSGAYQQTLIGDEILGAGWQVGFQTTLNQAKQKKYTLFILYTDSQDNVHRREYDISRPFEVDFTNEQWVQKIVHDGNGNIIVYVQYRGAGNSSDPTDTSPIFDHITSREQQQNNQLILSKDVYYKDPAGDAYLIEYSLQSVVPEISGVHVENDSIDASADQQKLGTYQTINWECGTTNKTYTVKLRALIIDRQGNQSMPFDIIFRCH